MCWLLQLLGYLSLLAGVVVLVLFFYGRGTGDDASPTGYHPTTLMFGVIAVVLGMLLLILGNVQGICQGAGIQL